MQVADEFTDHSSVPEQTNVPLTARLHCTLHRQSQQQNGRGYLLALHEDVARAHGSFWK